jgi:uncharacterized coiled-coil DUF342 family protein
MFVRKIIIKFFIVLLIIIFPFVILAQEVSTDEAQSDTASAVLQNKNAKRSQIQDRIQTQKEKFLEKRNEFKEKRKEAVEKFKVKREEFKEKIKGIRDKRKQVIVQRVDNKISNLNKLHTERFNNILERLSNVFDKIQARIDSLSAKGKDVSSVTSLIEIARNKISTAQTAVNEQAARDYIIELGDEEKLGEVVSTAHIEFKEDIKSVRDTVKDARKATLDVILELKDLVKNLNTEGGTE